LDSVPSVAGFTNLRIRGMHIHHLRLSLHLRIVKIPVFLKNSLF